MSSHEIDTIVMGVPCTIKYDYQPYEAPERWPEAQYPGCDEEIEVTQVMIGDVDVTQWFEYMDWFIEAVQEHLIRQRELKEEDRQFARCEKEMMYGY